MRSIPKKMMSINNYLRILKSHFDNILWQIIGVNKIINSKNTNNNIKSITMICILNN